MTGRLLLLALLMLGCNPAWAENPAECRVAENLAESSFRLPQVARALKAKHLAVLVVGAGSSQLPGSNGAKNAYPERLLQSLTQQLPGVEVKLTTDVKSKRTATEMVKALSFDLASAKPLNNPTYRTGLLGFWPLPRTPSFWKRYLSRDAPENDAGPVF